MNKKAFPTGAFYFAVRGAIVCRSGRDHCSGIGAGCFAGGDHVGRSGAACGQSEGQQSSAPLEWTFLWPDAVGVITTP